MNRRKHIFNSCFPLLATFLTWRMLPGRWVGLVEFLLCKQLGSFWWWRSTWQVGWTSHATPDQTPQWQRRNPAFFPLLMDHSSPGSYQPLGIQCQMGSTWKDEELLDIRLYINFTNFLKHFWICNKFFGNQFCGKSIFFIYIYLYCNIDAKVCLNVNFATYY